MGLHVMYKLWVNPLYPSINMQVLLTALYTSPTELARRICLPVKNFFNLQLFYLFSWSWWLIQGGYSEKKLIGYHSKGVKGQMEFLIKWSLGRSICIFLFVIILNIYPEQRERQTNHQPTFVMRYKFWSYVNLLSFGLTLRYRKMIHQSCSIIFFCVQYVNMQREGLI